MHIKGKDINTIVLFQPCVNVMMEHTSISLVICAQNVALVSQERGRTRHLLLINMSYMVPHIETPEKWKRFSQKVKKKEKEKWKERVSKTPAGLDND